MTNENWPEDMTEEQLRKAISPLTKAIVKPKRPIFAYWAKVARGMINDELGTRDERGKRC